MFKTKLTCTQVADYCATIRKEFGMTFDYYAASIATEES